MVAFGIVMSVLFVAALGVTIFLLVERKKARQQMGALGNELERVKKVQAELKEKEASADEYAALNAQIADLRALRDNLNGQVAVAKVELRGAEEQVDSAKTQFMDWQNASKAVREQLHEQERKLRDLRESGETQLQAELAGRREEGGKLVEAEAAQRRAEAEAELVKYLAELNKEVEEKKESCATLSKEHEELSKAADELQKLNERIAAEHSEALRRANLVEGEGGCINLSEADRSDTNDLRRLCRGMRCENAVLKATYDVYVKPEIERLVRDQGVSGVGGIYRIWRAVNGKELSYIGQAVDVGERWKTHAKRAWGVDSTGRIKLYQAMMESGIEEWHWELVEAVPSTICGSGAIGAFLSEREKYWGNFYAVKEIGLNSKLG